MQQSITRLREHALFDYFASFWCEDIEIAKAEGEYKCSKPIAVNKVTFCDVCAHWCAGEIIATDAM